MTMPSAPNFETVKASLNGRELSLKVPDVAQLGLIQHQARVLQRSNLTDEEGIRAMSVSFRVLFSFFPDKDDRMYVEDLIADGELDMVSLVRFVVDGTKGLADEEVVVKPQARRGRPRKTAS